MQAPANIMKIMLVALLAGLILTAMGVYLLLFTEVTRLAGIGGILLVVLLLTFGLLLLIPAKVYIIIQLTMKK